MRVLDCFRGELKRAFRGDFAGFRHFRAERPVDDSASDIEKRSGAKGKCADPAR
jgi:hypothetical protein